MKKVFLIFSFVLFLFPFKADAGYLFHMNVDSDGQKNKIVYWIEGQDKKVDVYMDGTLHSSMISSPKRKTPLFLMHDSETYMTKLPSANDMPTDFPEMKYEPQKKPVNPAEEVVKAMDNVEETQNKIEWFKTNPRDAAYDTMTDLAYEIEAKQQEKMMKQQMAKAQEMQKKMMSQLKQQQKMMKKRMEKEIARKNAISVKDFTVNPGNKTKKIGKYGTKLVKVNYKGALFQEVWVTKDIDSSIGKAMVSINSDSKLAAEGLDGFYKTIRKVNEKVLAYGVPVLTVSHFKNQNKILYWQYSSMAVPSKVSVSLTNYEKKSIAKSEFAPPKRYEEYKMTAM